MGAKSLSWTEESRIRVGPILANSCTFSQLLARYAAALAWLGGQGIRLSNHNALRQSRRLLLRYATVERQARDTRRS